MLDLKDEDSDIYKWQAKKGVTFLFFLTALKSWESSQLVTCACVLGMVTNPQYQSAFLKFGLGLALNTMSSSFRKLAGGQLYSCPVSWEARIMRRCSHKCHSLNGNAAGHVCTPWGVRAQQRWENKPPPLLW